MDSHAAMKGAKKLVSSKFAKALNKKVVTKIRETAVSLLLNLEAARQGRSVLFSDEQKLLFEGRKKGFAYNTKLDFMSC